MKWWPTFASMLSRKTGSRPCALKCIYMRLNMGSSLCIGEREGFIGSARTANLAVVFKQFAQDEGLPKDKNHPLLFVYLYHELVWGTNDANEVTGLSELRRLVEKNSGLRTHPTNGMRSGRPSSLLGGKSFGHKCQTFDWKQPVLYN